MEKLKIGIVEDELDVAAALALILKEIGYEVTEPAIDYDSAIKMIETDMPDFLIMDVQIAGDKDGIEVAHAVNKQYQLPFIFLTSMSDKETIERAKQTNPPAYLLKPFDREELYTSIEICFHNFTKDKNNKKEKEPIPVVTRDSIFVKNGGFFTKVKFADILYLESDHVYVNIHTKDKKIMVRSSLQQYVHNFDENVFIRIHRGFVVNSDHIESISNEEIIINKISLPIGKLFKNELMSKLQIR